MKQNRMRDNVHQIHFIGIGGVGMGGIAEILLSEGYKITGSDLNKNAMTTRLSELGVCIYHKHHEDNLEKADVVVVSSAIDVENPEVIAAKARRIPIVRRAAMLAELMRFRYGIAIAGTHGKTTTTSLLASLLQEAGLDPTYVIGGRLNSAGANAYLGESRYLVVEADESDASFLHLQPMMSVVTNIDADHMSTYAGDFSKLRQTFKAFIHNLPFYGLAVVCLDDPEIKDLLPTLSRPVLTYGFHDDADVRAHSFIQDGMQSQFIVTRKNKQDLFIILNMPGKHNVLNALAAIAIASELCVEDITLVNALKHFRGVGRRMEICGEYQLGAKKFTLIDDYGHHPRELKVTIEALKAAYPTRRVVMVYQPHRYSRTYDLYDDFCEVLAVADQLILLEIYSAGEKTIHGINSKSLCCSIEQRYHKHPILVADNDNLQTTLFETIETGDVVLMQGAGNISSLTQQLIQSITKLSQATTAHTVLSDKS